MSLSARGIAQREADKIALAERVSETGEGSIVAGRALGMGRNRAVYLWQMIRRELGEQAI